MTEPYYPDATTWFRDHFAPLVHRQLDAGQTWCAQWWAHPEAVSRLEALWRAWETLRLDPAFGISQWWRDHADPHLSVLLSRDHGPFAACTPTRHNNDLPELPHKDEQHPEVRTSPTHP